MVPIEKLEQINQRFQYLEAAMAEGGGDIAALGKEYSDLRPVVEQIAAYKQLLADLEEAQLMLDDPVMRELAEEELPLLKAQLPEVEKTLQITLLPKDAAAAGETAEYQYSWKRQNWFDYSAAEHKAVRDQAGLFDLSSFGKIRVEGRDACDYLQLICAADVDVAPGKIVYHLAE